MSFIGYHTESEKWVRDPCECISYAHPGIADRELRLTASQNHERKSYGNR